MNANPESVAAIAESASAQSPMPSPGHEEVARGAGAPRGPEADGGHAGEVHQRHPDDGRLGQRRERGILDHGARSIAARAARTRSRSSGRSVVESKVRAYAKGRTRTGERPMP